MTTSIRLLFTSLFISTLVACGGGGGSSGTAAIGSAILGMTLSADNAKLYLANADKQVIQSLTLSSSAVSTYAGGAGLVGTTNATALAARFYEPFGLVNLPAAGQDVFYIADTYNHGIRKIDAAGTVTTLAGSLGNPGANDATGTAALFTFPKGITTDGTNLYVADTNNHLIRQVTTAGVATTLAGTSGTSGYLDGAANTKFYAPFSLAATTTYVYVSDTGNNSIRSVKLSDNTVATVAGSTSGVSGTTDAAGTAARFNTPAAIVSDGATLLYVADSGSHTIRQIDLANSNTVSTIAGTAGISGSTDATGAAARFNNPIGLALDTTNGILYVSDQNYTKVRKIVLSTGVVTTVNASF